MSEMTTILMTSYLGIYGVFEVGFRFVSTPFFCFDWLVCSVQFFQFFFDFFFFVSFSFLFCFVCLFVCLFVLFGERKECFLFFKNKY